jgi:hypothetical protein
MRLFIPFDNVDLSTNSRSNVDDTRLIRKNGASVYHRYGTET